MKKLLCVVSACMIALPLYAQSGAPTTDPSMGAGQGSSTIPSSPDSDVQMEEDSKVVPDSSASPGSDSSTKTIDDIEAEEEKSEDSMAPSTTPSTESGSAPTTAPTTSP